MKALFSVLGIGLWLCSGAAIASGIEALNGFYQRVSSFEADFTQQQLDEQGEVVQQAAGIFVLSRPSKFRWEYRKPYDQIIVSNGETFRFYDVDLAQVTVRDVDETLRATPALLLSGGAALGDEFEISDAGGYADQAQGLSWVKLIPRDKEGDFREIRIGLDGDVPQSMQLDDNLGQTTEIEFTNIELNGTIAQPRFELDIPEGVEIVDGRAASQAQ